MENLQALGQCIGIFFQNFQSTRQYKYIDTFREQLQNTREIRGGRYLRINLLGQFISDIIEIIRPFLEDKRLSTFRNMDIGGCMCKFCQDIVCDNTIEPIGVRL